MKSDFMNIAKVDANANPCASCGVCVAACPCSAIAYGRDGDGFLRPSVDESKCNGCGICRKICYKLLEEITPFENTFKDKPVYAAWSKEPDVVAASASGGVGYELTKHFFDAGYSVCGCIFDAPNDECKHIIAASHEDLEAIRTSKYLQSDTVAAFSKFEAGKKHLVIGTPCQIYGLRKWAETSGREDDFVLVDFFCHGTPSFNLWKKFKKHFCVKHGISQKWESVNFRAKVAPSENTPPKKFSWHRNAMKIFSGGYFLTVDDAFQSSLFFKFYLNNSCLNDSCCQCKLRLDHCASDLRLADFWGPKYAHNDTGVTLVVANTEKGAEVWNAVRDKFAVEECSHGDLLESQPTRWLTAHEKRMSVLKTLKGKWTLDKIFRKHCETPPPHRGVRRVKSFAKKTIKKVLAKFGLRKK